LNFLSKYTETSFHWASYQQTKQKLR